MSAINPEFSMLLSRLDLPGCVSPVSINSLSDQVRSDKWRTDDGGAVAYCCSTADSIASGTHWAGALSCVAESLEEERDSW